MITIMIVTVIVIVIVIVIVRAIVRVRVTVIIIVIVGLMNWVTGVFVDNVNLQDNANYVYIYNYWCIGV